MSARQIVFSWPVSILHTVSVIELKCPTFLAVGGRLNLAPQLCLDLLIATNSKLPQRFPDGTEIATSRAKMFPRPVSISRQTPPYCVESIARRKTFLRAVVELPASMVHGLYRRWRRERRRRAVGRAYDMALEVARLVPAASRVLDVGCGNGFIAHHLTAMLGVPVVGIDLAERAAAPIEYLRYDGKRLPIANQCMDTVLLCYVLHHAQDFDLIMREVRRVLRRGGLVVVYEDIPCCWLDRAVCWIHNRQWQNRTGQCTFRLASVWRTLFSSAGFEIVAERPLSRWRNLTHPVCRSSYILKLGDREAEQKPAGPLF